MFNLKLSGITAGLAFILSFAIGMIRGVTFPILIIRAGLFAVIFLVMSVLIRGLVSRFIPELLMPELLMEENNTAPSPGSNINITDEDSYYPSQEASSGVSIGAKPDDTEDGLGNITELLEKGNLDNVDSPQTGMDQNGQDGYTKDEGLGEFSPSPLPPAFNETTPPAASKNKGKAPAGRNTGDFADSMEALPDLESMEGAFGSGSGLTDSDNTPEYSAPASDHKQPSKNKSPEWSEDFHAKDMAEGLRTILSKEKEG